MRLVPPDHLDQEETEVTPESVEPMALLDPLDLVVLMDLLVTMVLRVRLALLVPLVPWDPPECRECPESVVLEECPEAEETEVSLVPRDPMVLVAKMAPVV